VLDEIRREVGDVRVSMFADDLAVWCSDRDKERARQKVQRAVNVIADWSQKWMLKLNVAKCETMLFSMDAAEAEYKPSIEINGEECTKVKLATFLGVTYDRRLCFNEHVKRVTEKAKKRINIMRAVASQEWGFDQELLKSTYIAMCRSVIEYGLVAWYPWISKTDREKIEKVQLEAARVITGLVVSSPKEAVLLEADLNEICKRALTNCTIAVEKSRRLNKNNPRKAITEKDIKIRLKKGEWREQANKRWRDIMETDRVDEKWNFPRMCKPWLEIKNKEYVNGLEGKKSESERRNKEEAMRMLERGNDWDVTIYTDGSAEEGRKIGGAAAVVTSGAAENLQVKETI